MATISWYSLIENHFLKFCVGDCVGEQLPHKFERRYLALNVILSYSPTFILWD